MSKKYWNPFFLETRICFLIWLSLPLIWHKINQIFRTVLYLQPFSYTQTSLVTTVCSFIFDPPFWIYPLKQNLPTTLSPFSGKTMIPPYKRVVRTMITQNSFCPINLTLPGFYKQCIKINCLIVSKIYIFFLNWQMETNSWNLQ